MFEDVHANSINKIVEIREYLNFISTNVPSPPTQTPKFVNTGKGLIYVLLYGVIESLVISTISKCINIINNESLHLSDLKTNILSLALNSDLDALIQTSTHKWDKRFNLFNKIELNEIVNISTDLLPTDGKNIHRPQLESIWRVFSIIDPVFHDIKFATRLKDIVANRINIAHGNLSASDIGKKVTISDLEVSIGEVSDYCSYLISVFENYVVDRRFIKD